MGEGGQWVGDQLDPQTKADKPEDSPATLTCLPALQVSDGGMKSLCSSVLIGSGLCLHAGGRDCIFVELHEVK